MNLMYKNLTLRNAAATDAEQLWAWWNDGRVMTHAGFPSGLNETPENIRKSLADDRDDTHRRHIIERDGKSIGEMNYRNKGDRTAEIGIKICDFAEQGKGYGTTLLRMFIDALFTYYDYEKVILDTNVKNERAQHMYERKLGFRRVAVRENSWHNQLGEQQSSVDYEMSKAEWSAVRDKTPKYLHLRLETPSDHYAVEAITREAFWDFWEPGRTICDEHLLVHRLRSASSFVPELDYIAELDGKLAGHIIYSKSKVVDDAGNEHEALTFGPLTVAPEVQNRGVGQALMRRTFAEAKRLGYRAVMIFGHPDYYPRAGFRRAAEFGITTADGQNFDPFMALPLYDGALDGIHGRLILDPVYEGLTQEDVLEFDKRFPPKTPFTPTPIDVLLNRLAPDARKAIEGLHLPSLEIVTTKSQREISALPGIDGEAVETIRTVMREHGHGWGERRSDHANR